MLSLTIGEVAPKPFWPVATQNGIKIEQEFNGSFWIANYLMNVTNEEDEIISNNKIIAKYIIDNTDSMLLTFIGYEGSDIIHEIIFDPTLYPEEQWALRKMGWEIIGIVLILLIDSMTGVLKSLRIESWPDELKEVRKRVWGNALAIKNYSKIYKQWIADAATLSVVQLWDLAQDAGYFSRGELINIDFGTII
jgi:hypothetical protein